jgi:hypothetical protein
MSLAVALCCCLLGLGAPAAPKAPTFTKTVLDTVFRSEGVAVADVNRDGKKDILAGNLWYEAPSWTAHEIAPPGKFDGATGYSNSFINFSQDVNRDGYPDQILIGMPAEKAVWRENPGKGNGPWVEHTIWRSACNESPIYGRLLPGKAPVLVFPYDEAFMGWYEPADGPAWTAHTVSEKGQPGCQRFSHGLGIGDANGDGRPDILTAGGWYQAPENPRQCPWPFVAASLGPDCATMYVLDVNGDRLPDIISSSAHDKGVWWHERKPGDGAPQFERHIIDESFTEAHAVEMADLDRDGAPELVTGKRFWAHGPNGDPDANGAAVIYWYKLRRTNGHVTWERHEVDRDSGVGTQFTVTDLNGDGLLDIVTANKKGVFCFVQDKAGKR